MDYSHGQNRKPVSVRVPIDLHEWLAAEAERSARSVAGEILWRVRQSVEAQKREEAAA
jgi:hypothetical protein